jgi:hypothetical protein
LLLAASLLLALDPMRVFSPVGLVVLLWPAYGCYLAIVGWMRRRGGVRAIAPLMVPPALAVALGGSWVSGVLGAAQFRLSQGALRSAGRSALVGGHPTRAGLYDIRNVSTDGGCAYLITGSFALSAWGFAYCEGSSRPNADALASRGGGLWDFQLRD